MEKILFASAATFLAIGASCYAGRVVAAESTGQTQTITRAADTPYQKAPTQFFTGNVTVRHLFQPKQPDAPFGGAHVTFEPGARSHWHTHPTGQHLVVTEGVGRTGTADGNIEEFKAGDVLWCPEGVKHWHGAAPDQSMTHLALTGTLPDGNNVNWMEPVSDDQYNGRT